MQGGLSTCHQLRGFWEIPAQGPTAGLGRNNAENVTQRVCNLTFPPNLRKIARSVQSKDSTRKGVRTKHEHPG